MITEPTTSRWIALLGGKRAELRTRPIPTPGPREVLVRAAFTQVSAGTEMNQFVHRAPDDDLPLTSGYTMVGTVEEVGSAVPGVQRGQRVLCAGPHGDHFLVNLDAPDPKLRGLLLPIPDGLAFEPATFAILGDVALHGVRRARLQIDQSVAVFGLGTIGQLVCRLARLSGAHPVVGVDPLPERRAFAERYGATHTLDPREDLFEAFRQLTGRPGAEAVFQVTANPRALVDCLRAAGERATVVLVGSAPGTVELGLQHELLRRELSILACYEAGLETAPHPYWPWTRNRNREAIWRLIQRGELDVAPLISHVAEPEEAPEIYRMLASGGEGWMSVLFHWS